MDKLVADSRTTPPASMTAVQDLKMYQKFSEAYVDAFITSVRLIACFPSYAGRP